MINIDKLEAIKKRGFDEDSLNLNEFADYKEKLEKNTLIYFDGLQSFVNSDFSKDSLGELLVKYEDYKNVINDFYNNGGLNSNNNSSINIGFQTFQNDKKQNAVFYIDAFMEKMQQILEGDWSSQNDVRLKINQEINQAGIFEYNEDTYSRELNLSINSVNGKFLENLMFVHNYEIKELLNETGLKLQNLNQKEMFCLYNYGINEAIRNIDNQNSEEFQKSIKSLKQVTSKQINVIDEKQANNVNSYSLYNDNGEINKDYKKYYDLMKEEKDTSWLKNNIHLFTQEVLESLDIKKSPIIEFTEEIFKNIETKDFDLEAEIELGTLLFKDDKIKSLWKKEDILNYLTEDFPTPVVFKCMIDALDKSDLYSKFDDKYNFTEKMLSVLIGEDSSIDNFNENKVACLVNLMNHSDFDVEKKLNISTSKNLQNLLQKQHENLHNDNSEKPEITKMNKIVDKSIPNQLSYNGNNKISIIEFLSNAQDHLIIQNINSDYNNHEKEDTLFNVDNGFLMKSVKKDWFDLIKSTIPNEDFNATKFKGKVQKLSNYFNSWSGPMSSVLGFIGVLGCALFIGAAKVMEKNQNNKIRDHLNKYTSELKLSIDEVKTKMTQYGDIEISAVVDGEELAVCSGKNCQEMRAINSGLQLVSTSKHNLFAKIINKLDEAKYDLTNEDIIHPIKRAIEQHNEDFKDKINVSKKDNSLVIA